LTKSELIERVARDAGLTKGRAEMVVNTIFDSMVLAMVQGEGVEIRGFGSFTVRQYKAYEGRNPRTGDVVHVAPKRLPHFKVGKELRERVNGSYDPSQVARPETRATPSPKPAAARRREENLSEDVI
jgi:integration host factor subunit beta